MQDDINEIKQDVKEIKGTLTEHAIHLAKYNTLLDIHIARSNALENEIKIVEKELKPVLTHVTVVNNLSKVISIIFGGGLIFKIIYFFWSNQSTADLFK